MLGNDHFKPFPNIAKLLYHSLAILETQKTISQKTSY